MTATLTIRLPASLARELKARTKAAKTSPSAVLRRAAATYLRRKKSEPKAYAMQEHIDAYAAAWDAGARTCEGVDEALGVFARIELNFASAWRAGQAFRQHRPAKGEASVLPDLFIRAQAAMLNLPHLTNDRRRLAAWPDV